MLAVVRVNGWLYKVMSEHNGNLQLAKVRNWIGNYDWLTVREFKRFLDQFDPDIVVSHGQRSTLFANRVKSANNSRWPQVPLVQANLKQKYYKGVDLLIPHTESQAKVDYHMDLVDPKFSEVIPLFASFDPVTEVRRISPARNLFSVGMLCMLFELGQSAGHRWRRLRGFRKLG